MYIYTFRPLLSNATHKASGPERSSNINTRVLRHYLGQKGQQAPCYCHFSDNVRFDPAISKDKFISFTGILLPLFIDKHTKSY